MMQIVSGLARGIVLDVPPGGEVRPTAVRARKALFDSLGPWEGKKIWDLFAGSGALGLEALSRGASRCVFVESHKRHVNAINRNIEKVKKSCVTGECEVIARDIFSVHEMSFVPDIIFGDPPYAVSEATFFKLLKQPFMQSLPRGSLLVWEIPDTAPAMKAIVGVEGWKTKLIKNYGSIWFLVLFKEEIVKKVKNF